MGGVCSGGTSAIQDAKEGSGSEFSGSPGNRSLTSSSVKQKEVSLSDHSGDEIRKVLQEYDAGESHKLKLSPSAKKGPSKVLHSG